VEWPRFHTGNWFRVWRVYSGNRATLILAFRFSYFFLAKRFVQFNSCLLDTVLYHLADGKHFPRIAASYAEFRKFFRFHFVFWLLQSLWCEVTRWQSITETTKSPQDEIDSITRRLISVSKILASWTAWKSSKTLVQKHWLLILTDDGIFPPSIYFSPIFSKNPKDRWSADLE